MSGSSTRVRVAVSTNAPFTYGIGRPARAEAVHRKPARVPLNQAPVIRESTLPSHSTPPGPGAEYGPALQSLTVTSIAPIELDPSGQPKTRNWRLALWLAKNIEFVAPWVRRSEPWVVVDHHW